MNLKSKLAKLVDVKSIVTFALVGTLCFLAIRQDTQIPTELYTAVVTAVITYFFTKSREEVREFTTKPERSEWLGTPEAASEQSDKGLKEQKDTNKNNEE